MRWRRNRVRTAASSWQVSESWWERQIQRGWKGPMGLPLGSSFAAFPLRTSTRYRVSLSPGKSHLLAPGTDHAYCGLTLAPTETWLIETGYDEYYWIVEENRDEKSWCKDCSRWQMKWRVSGQQDFSVKSPIGADEWAATVGAETVQRKQKLDMMAETVAAWIGEGATVQ